MVLDRWKGVSGVPGLGQSVPGSRATPSSHQPLRQWDEKGKKGPKNKLQVGSKNTQKTNIAKINVRLPRILSIRSSSFSSGLSSVSKTHSNASNNGKNESGFGSPPPLQRGFSIPPPLQSGFSMPPPLPRVQTTSSAARNSGRKQWKPLITSNQEYHQQKMVQDYHPMKMTGDYHHQNMPGGDSAIGSPSTGSKASYHKDQKKSRKQPLLSKSKSFRSSQCHSIFDRGFAKTGNPGTSFAKTSNPGTSFAKTGNPGTSFAKTGNHETSFLPSDCNYYPCSRCNCCCDMHKPPKRVMFREVTSEASSFPTKKAIVGVKQHLKSNHHGGPFEYSEAPSNKALGYSDKMYENISEYVGRSYSEGVLLPRWSRNKCVEHAFMSENESHASSNYPYSSRLENPSDHYQSPKEIDGDYSYAYSDCISPAFLIRSEEDPAFNENIYEEINTEDKAQEDADHDTSADFSTSPQSSFKSLSSSQKSLMLESKRGENSNSLKREAYGRVVSEELNGAPEWRRVVSEELNGGPECAAMFGDLEEVNRRMSQLNMDVKDLLHPLTYSNHSRGTEDSGFDSGEMSSINSSSMSTSKSSVVSRTSSSEVLKCHGAKCSEVLKSHGTKCAEHSDAIDPNLSNKSVRVSLVDMSHAIDDLDHIVGILKGDIDHHL